MTTTGSASNSRNAAAMTVPSTAMATTAAPVDDMRTDLQMQHAAASMATPSMAIPPNMQPTTARQAAPTTAPPTTKLQQRAAAAAQYLNSGQRRLTCRDVQMQLEKNEAAIRAWSYLHAQQPSRQHATEHKSWMHKCLALRQQIGARLEVLASLADKQIAHEDASDQANKAPARTAPATAAKKPAQSTQRAKSSKATKAVTTTTRPRQTQPKTQPSVANTLVSSNPSTVAATSAPSFPETPLTVTGMSSSQPTATNGANMFYSNAPTSTTTSASGAGYPITSMASGTMSMAQSSPLVVTSNTQTYSMPMNSATASGYPTTSYSTSTGPVPGTNAGFMVAPNYMMNGMGAMNFGATSGMMNPQLMGMAMQNQMTMMAMNSGNAAGMYNPSMFATNNGYGGMSATHLPSDPFNASFQTQPNPFSTANAAGFNMTSAQMMGQMGFNGMANPQMMMNPMAFGMGISAQQMQQFQQQQQQQQQRFQQNAVANANFQARQQQQLQGSQLQSQSQSQAPAQLQSSQQQPQQPQQPQQIQQTQRTQQAQQLQRSQQLQLSQASQQSQPSLQPQQQSQQQTSNALFPDTTFADDSTDSLFDGLPDDAFLSLP